MAYIYGKVTVRWGEPGNVGYASIELGPVQCARVVAAARGFNDLDLEPLGDAGYKLTASDGKVRIGVKGKTLTDVCEKLLEALYG
jgi:hypothetical protein